MSYDGIVKVHTQVLSETAPKADAADHLSISMQDGIIMVQAGTKAGCKNEARHQSGCRRAPSICRRTSIIVQDGINHGAG
jgi:hypothetical protein